MLRVSCGSSRRLKTSVRETIQVRRLQVLVAVAAQRIPSHVIREDMQDIWLRCEERRAEGEEKKQTENHRKVKKLTANGGSKYQNTFLRPDLLSENWCFG